MRTEENEAGGKTIVVYPGDDLEKIPRSHRDLLTAPLREVFETGPRDYFQRVADRCPFASMQAWLRALTDEDVWDLAFHRAGPEIPVEWTEAGFRWWTDAVTSAEITPARQPLREDLPPALLRYYALVDRVSWMPFGCAGGLEGAGPHEAVANFGYACRGADLDPSRSFVFGTNSGGDMLICTEDGRGGWLCHENGNIRLLGTIEEMIDWIYAELCAGRCPEYDYGA